MSFEEYVNCQSQMIERVFIDSKSWTFIESEESWWQMLKEEYENQRRKFLYGF